MKTYTHSQLAKVLSHLPYAQLQILLDERGIKPCQTLKTNAATLRMYDEAAYLSACSIRDEYVKQRDARRALKVQAQAKLNDAALTESNEDLPIKPVEHNHSEATCTCSTDFAALSSKVDQLIADINRLTTALGGV